MNKDVIFISNQIMEWFKENNSSVDDIMTCNHLLSLSCKPPIWNSQQRNAIPDAIQHLIEQGYITANANDYIRLTKKGYEKIHMMNQSEIIMALLEKYQSGDASSIDPSEYNIDRNKLLEIVEIMEKGKLITGASIVRAGRENKILLGWPEKAQITLQGINYLNGRSTPIMSQTNFNINNSSLVGSQIGTSNSQLYFNQNDFSGEISRAISEIKTIAELSEENKVIIIDLLKQIDDAIQSNNKDAQTEVKFTLKGVLKGIGNAGVKVISVLSGLANLANFFGFAEL